ncbi:MAG: cyclic nucleotide-binding domain-containing protein, partial [Myxococcota bacterium]
MHTGHHETRQHFTTPILRRTPMFQAMSDEALDQLAPAFAPATLEPGQFLFRQGDLGQFMALLVDGALGIQLNPMSATYDGTLTPYELIGEMTCIDPAPRSASIVALQPTQLLILDRQALDRIRTQSPGVFSLFLRAVAQRVSAKLRTTNEAIGARNSPTGALPALDTQTPRPRQLREKGPLKTGGFTAVPGADQQPHEALAVFSERELEILSTVAQRKLYPAGSMLCREGNVGRSCFIIDTGLVEISRERDGMKVEVGTLGPGEILGQLALLDNSVRSATALAVRDTVVVELS